MPTPKSTSIQQFPFASPPSGLSEESRKVYVRLIDELMRVQQQLRSEIESLVTDGDSTSLSYRVSVLEQGSSYVLPASITDRISALEVQMAQVQGQILTLSALLGIDMTNIAFGDSANIDSFSRLRVSNPEGLFDSQLTYDLQPLIYEQLVNETGASIAHSSTERVALMTFASTPSGGYAYMQGYEHVRYQPGKSQAIFVTFNFIEAVANVLKFAGYSDGNNGVEFRLNGTQLQFAILSDTSLGDEIVAQSNWNIDKMDGTGQSGFDIDVSKTQIVVIDLQALYVGRVRVGFDIDGVVYYAHEFLHSNVSDYPYIQTASLPIRCGMSCTGTVSTTMNFICTSVISEGGQEEVNGFSFSQAGSVTAASGARTHALSLRPATSFNSITNRIKLILESLEVLVTGSNPVLWELCIGQAISGTTTFSDVNATYSAFQYNTAGTLSGSPAIVLASGFVSATNQSKSSLSYKLSSKAPVTLDAAGAVRALGTLSLILTGLGGNSDTQYAFNWKELR